MDRRRAIDGVGLGGRGRALGFERLEHRHLLAAGFVDQTFGDDGTVTLNDLRCLNTPKCEMSVQSDGKMVMVGTADGLDADLAVARLHSNGTLDNSFAGDGVASTDFDFDDDYGTALAIQADGKIVAGGDSGDNGYFALARYCVDCGNGIADGTLDTSFGTNGEVKTFFDGLVFLYDIAIQPDGKIVAVGQVILDGAPYAAIARYHVDGSLDEGFGTGGTVVTDFGGEGPSSINAVAIQDDGRIILAGKIGDEFAVGRLTTNGDLDFSFGASNAHASIPFDVESCHAFCNAATDVTIDSEGRIIVVGSIPVPDDLNSGVVARFLPDGSVDDNFGVHVTRQSDYVPFRAVVDLYAVTLQSGGLVTAVGTTWLAGKLTAVVIRFGPFGTPDTGFGYLGLGLIPSASSLQPTSVFRLGNDDLLIGGRTAGAYATLTRMIGWPEPTFDPDIGGLTVPGTVGHDVIEISADGPIVTVEYHLDHGRRSFEYQNVQTIDVNTEAGDDALRYTLTADPDTDLPELTARTGAGADHITVQAVAGESHDGTLRANIFSGDDDDQVDFDLTGFSKVETHVETGTGDDAAQARLAAPVDSPVETGVITGWLLAYDVGTGADLVDVRLDFPEEPQAKARPARVEMHSDDGDDTFRVRTNDAPVIGDSFVEHVIPPRADGALEDACLIWDLVGPDVSGGPDSGSSNRDDMGRFQLILGHTTQDEDVLSLHLTAPIEAGEAELDVRVNEHSTKVASYNLAMQSLELASTAGRGSHTVDVRLDFPEERDFDFEAARIEMHSEDGDDTFRVRTSDAPVIGDSFVEHVIPPRADGALEDACLIWDLVGPDVEGGPDSGSTSRDDVGRFQLVLGHTETRAEGVLSLDLTAPLEAGEAGLRIRLDEDSADLAFQHLRIESLDLAAANPGHLRRVLKDIEIVGPYREQLGKPLRIVAEDVEAETLVSDNVEIGPAGSFVSRSVSGDSRNRVVSVLRNVTNHGEFQQLIDVGGGADVVLQAVWGFENHGTAVFDTHLGSGADYYQFIGHSIDVAAGATLELLVHGDDGRDRIVAIVSARVDGDYRFEASGGSGRDRIVAYHAIPPGPPRGSDARPSGARPAIDILIEEHGDDWLASWLRAPGIDIADGEFDSGDLVVVVQGGGIGRIVERLGRSWRP